MFLPLALILATKQKRIDFSYHLFMNTEALSPQARHADIIRDKRKAYDFFFLLKPGAPKPLSLKKINWRHTNVLVIYPGLVQRDARLKVLGIKKHGQIITAVVLGHNGITTETYYPIILATIPKQPNGVHVDVPRVSPLLASRHGKRER
jgi:hypothetical protein